MGKKMTNERIADATQRVYAGESVASSARSYGCHRNTVTFALYHEQREATHAADKRYRDARPGLGAARSKQWRDDHPEYREIARVSENLYNETHREQRKAYAAEWRKKHPAYMAEYMAGHYQRNKEACKARQSEYRAANPEKVKESKRQYQYTHKDVIAAKSKVWRSENLPYILAANAARHAMILGATIGNLAEIKEVYRQAHEDEPIRCYLCGKLIEMGDRHVDHKIPLSKGGKHCVSNLGITHSFCNLSKHDAILGGDSSL